MGNISRWSNGHKWGEPHKERGLTLIEVLIAVLILGVGVMGYAALQLKSVRMTEDTYSRGQAMSIAQDLVERVRVNKVSASDYLQASWAGQNSQPSATCISTSVGSIGDDACSSAELAAMDVYQVRYSTETMMENGKIKLTQCNNNNADLYCVTVAWAKTPIASCNQAEFTNGQRGDSAHCIVLEFTP